MELKQIVKRTYEAIEKDWSYGRLAYRTAQYRKQITMSLTLNGKRTGRAGVYEKADQRQYIIDMQNEYRRQVREETEAICEAILLFFDNEMWAKFVDAGPDDNAGFLQYVKDEWNRIAVEFEIAQ